MKILLPKTLAEPLTIGWPKLMINDLAMHIVKELKDFFHYMYERGILPEKIELKHQLPSDAIARILIQTALNKGATTAFVDILHLRDGNKDWEIVGCRYEVNFTVPDVGTVLRVSLDSWF